MYRRGCVILIIFLYTLVVVAPLNLKRQKRIVGGRPAAQPIIDDPVVYVTRNNRQARIYGSRDSNKGFYVFRGIRFGLPPVGQYRFQRAVPLHLEGDINATKWGPPCPQPNPFGGQGIVGSEDCLFLNVFTPMLPDAGEGYPVLIWIHGGGFRRGSACQYEMRNIIRKKVVVVSIQYRLGSLGFLSSGTQELPGNNGIFDMMLAVRWVKNYIQYFGGNPKKIIAFGHGTGASSAFMLALSKLSKGAFSGLIAMSGSILSHFAIDKDPSSTAQYIASKNGCPTENVIEMVRCLREIPVDKLIQTDSSLETIRSGLQGFVSSLSNVLGPGPVIEGSDDERFLPNLNVDTPEDSLKGDFPKIPLLTGVMNNEVGGAIFGDYRAEIENKLRSNPNFFNEYLIPVLQNTVPNFGNRTNFAPEAFTKYLNVLNKKNNSLGISKVAEAIGDSLYNVPAFLTVEHWAKRSEAFLYSFDHNGKRKCGRDFLIGSPIATASHALDGITSHGDDLGYIFKQNTITGEAIQNVDESDEEDKRVEEAFTNLIAEFARNGKPNVAFQSQNGSLLSNLTSAFSSDTNSFISITSAPHLMKQFRFCEIALWTGLVKRLQSSTCSYFRTTLDLIDKSAQKAKNAMENPIQALNERVSDAIPDSTVLTNRTIPIGINIPSKNRKGGIFRNLGYSHANHLYKKMHNTEQ